VLERDPVALLIQGSDDFVEAQETANQGQMLAVPREFRLHERARATMRPSSVMSPIWMEAPLRIKRSAQPTAPSGCFLRSHLANQVLVIERGDHERVVRKSGFAHDAFDFRLGREMRKHRSCRP